MTTPELSVVIASINGVSCLQACLAALDRQVGDVTAEVIVADCVGPEVQAFILAEHPEVRLITFDEPRSIPELRAAGILAAHGALIAITEDHCIPAPDWYVAIRRIHAARPEPAIGGAVDNAATRRSVDWAVFFCEYSNYISPVHNGVVHDLPGPNVSYKRDALLAMDDLLRGGYWETFLHWRLEQGGAQLWSAPQVRVLHKKHFRFSSFLAERYHYARAFAGTRNESISLARRLIYLVCSPLLPPLLLTRIARRVLRHKRYLPTFALALPYIVVFMFAWAAGECVGYAIGPGASALQLT